MGKSGRDKWGVSVIWTLEGIGDSGRDKWGRGQCYMDTRRDG